MNRLVVPTIKNNSDKTVPNEIEIETSFSIGQEVCLEYDVHNKRGIRVGYGGWTSFSPSKEVGQFKVSGIFMNMLANPPKPMIEFESMDDKFNQAYPDQKKLLVEESVAIKRLRDKTPPLDADQEISVEEASFEPSENNHPATRRLNLTVQCMAIYQSGIDVPYDMSFEDAIAYAKQNLHKVPLGVLEYVSDSDVLDEENCDFEEEVERPSLEKVLDSAQARGETKQATSVCSKNEHKFEK